MRVMVIGEGWIKTGFGTVVTNLVKAMRELYGPELSMALYGVNWRDTPAGPETVCDVVFNGTIPKTDMLGYDALCQCAAEFAPELVIMINDPTPCAIWANRIRLACGPDVDLVAYIPVDGEIVDVRPYVELERSNVRLVAFTLYGAAQVKATRTMSRIECCYPGIDMTHYNLQARTGAREWWNADQGKELLKPDDFVICSTNRNAPRKMLHMALMAIEAFVAGKPNVKLFIRAGRDDWAGDFYPIMQRIKCETIVLDPDQGGGRGVPDEEMARLYGASDVFISASVTEGWGLCEIEAACCGCELVLPNNTVRPELWREFAFLAPCVAPFYSPRFCNTIGAIATPTGLRDMLSMVHREWSIHRPTGQHGTPYMRMNSLAQTCTYKRLAAVLVEADGRKEPL